MSVVVDDLLPARTDFGVEEPVTWTFSYVDPLAARKQALGWALTVTLFVAVTLAGMTAGTRGPTFVPVAPVVAGPADVDPRALPALAARDSGRASALPTPIATAPELTVGRYAMVPTEPGRACYWNLSDPGQGVVASLGATSVRAGWVTTVGWVEVSSATSVLRSSDCFWVRA